MITILEDPHHYHAPDDHALRAADITDYVPVRIRIRQAIDQQQSLIVVVTHQTLLRWLSDLRDYPADVILWQVVDPARHFEDIFGVIPSPPFTSPVIATLDLATLTPPPPNVTVDPIAWILGQRLHDIWGHTTPYEGHLAALIGYLAEQSDPPPDQLRPLIQAQLRRWAEIQPVYDDMHPASLHQDSTRLLLRWAFQGYDATWLREHGLAPCPLIDAQGQEAVCMKLLPQYDTAIRAYWSHVFARSDLSEVAIQTALMQMSGLSETELHMLVRVVEQHPVLLNEQLLTKLQQRFSHLSTIKTVVRDLAAQMPPAVPAMPETGWADTQWLRWATQEYLPYFAWVMQAKQSRDYQQTCAVAFGDWLVERYPAWLNHEDSPLLLHQFPRMRQILTDDVQAVVIWLVVDGLTWWQGQILREACEHHDLYPQAHIPGIAALPSITSVSKRVLVTGLPASEPTAHAITKVAQEHMTRSGIDARVCRNLQEATTIVDHDETVQCVLVLFNMIDTIAHQMTTFTDDEGIRGYLRGLAEQLAQCMHHCTSRGKRCHALIGSDHGSTFLPADATMVPLPRATREIEDLWADDQMVQPQSRSTRAAIVTDPQRLQHLDNDAWYSLEQQRYQLDGHYIVPRGYQYIKRRPPGWTHGGLTPEEVIVPLLYLTPERGRVQPLAVDLQGALRAAQQSTLTVEIVNPNPFSLDTVVLEISGSTQPIMIEQIAPTSRHHAEAPMEAVTSQEVAVPLTWFLRCTTVSGAYEQAGKQTLSVRRLQTTDTILDDFLDL